MFGVTFTFTSSVLAGVRSPPRMRKNGKQIPIREFGECLGILGRIEKMFIRTNLIELYDGSLWVNDNTEEILISLSLVYRECSTTNGCKDIQWGRMNPALKMHTLCLVWVVVLQWLIEMLKCWLEEFAVVAPAGVNLNQTSKLHNVAFTTNAERAVDTGGWFLGKNTD